MPSKFLLNNALAPVAGASATERNTESGLRTIQATVAGTGAVTATVLIEFSNDGSSWLLGATMTLSGTTQASDGFAVTASWLYCRANLTAVSGTGSAVNVIMAW